MARKAAIWISLFLLFTLPSQAFGDKLFGVTWSYVPEFPSKLVEINPANGLISVIGLTNFVKLNSLAKDDAGRLYSVSNHELIRIDRSTGLGITVATLDLGIEFFDVRGLAFSPAGELYAIVNPGLPGGGPLDLYRINILTGMGAKINTAPIGYLTSITFSPLGLLFGWEYELGLVTIDTVTGTISDVNPAIGGPEYFIAGIAFSPDAILYGAGAQDDGAHGKLYTIDFLTGAVTLVGTDTSYAWVRGLEFLPDIKPSTIIGACWSAGNSKVVQINPTTADISTIGPSGFANLNSLAKDPAGNLFSVGGPAKNQLLRINRASGLGTPVKTLNFGAAPVDVRGLAFSPTGILYASNCRPGGGIQDHDLYSINLETGVGTRINSENTPLPPIQGLTFSPGGLLYGWDVDAYGLIRINRFTGAFTDVNPAVGGTSGIQGIAFSPNGSLYGAGRLMGENDKLYIIDSATGAYSMLGEAAALYDVRGIEFITSRRALPAFPLLLWD